MKQSLIEVLVRGIPEGLLFTYAVYLFSKKDLRLKPFLISGVLLGIAVYIIRLLPIRPGINNILNIIVFIALSTKVNSIDLIKSIKSVFIATMLGFVCEGINVLLIQYVFKLDVNHVFSVPHLKILYGMPSLVILGFILFIVSYFNKIRLKNKKVEASSM
jgi:hypothetical protein